ncbi:hypothetical protein HanXRQr2_Chr11g0482461 [Helianthus annuus]|uniref:Hapless 8 n=1 Tax=Helianthus annuus TaxID=4232 RepID=A0A251RP67_HELAN|nr:uncharacterized protein LOC110921299 [Helianthus annuus]XP_022021283.1 uncharacterized protein LOC110921299 [Helianthus annuus]XP_022021284.1 uncharacterized protein LOC110921299 [Helianthus annuus]KAF5781347.1 hypothetical protein HanXRQr2_Chr11g0482461 [Helianthus annuus]KAJ0516866.1 hypothetical protein HanHA89_Chr11g0418641 [Helianthus annuus]KAJ0684871.1 hypothetical protein HanLR1_Chr11g0396071 [Helianthus annuus]
MISIDDHAASDHNQQQKPHDLKVSDIDLKSTDAALDDTSNPLPNFSIRDYVFGLRSKDIAGNWPFSSKSLQLCLKHGVKNLLPPFESLDSLRNNSSLTRCGLENRSPDEELVTSFDGKPANDLIKPNKKIASTIPSGSKEEKGQSGQTRSKEKEKPPASSQKARNVSVNIITKKSRLVVKVNSGVEHVTPNSETMASKVCPVCKIFSSSSNTTLNAHIDQCLTGEGTMKWTENPKVIVKHKVKPRKMRLMPDIYKTAPHCTVEELDRRNGTSWATNSSFPAQESQFQGEEEEEDEEEKEEPRLTKVNHEAADNEGDVYIDTNGTKVRILSVPKISASGNLEGRKIQKGVKGSKLMMGKKNKNNLIKKKHHKKYLKLTPNTKKLCPPKPKVVYDPAKSGQREDVVMAENCSKDERGKEITKVADSVISRPPWACSKRSGLSIKFSDKNRKVEPKRHKTKVLVVENSDKTFSGSDLSSSQSRKKTISSLSLVKKPLNTRVEFRKEATRMHHNDDEDDDGDGDSESDDDSDDEDYDCQGTLDAANRSKSGKLSSLSRNLSFPASKFSLKRKFSSVEKSRVKSVDGPSQDSSKEQSRMEEHASINKKQETRSITSKGSNEESSVGIQTVNGNESECVKNGTLLSIRPPSFMGLSSSFDPEFSNQECIELYQDQICSTNRAPNDVDQQENYFQEVDPIPIPGPPGSFLPASPGGEMVSEEPVQETRVHSSENQRHHDTIDRDSMSNSPVSTVSNSRSSCGKDEMYTKPYFNGDTGVTETVQSHSSFKNDQPCCCSRKEAVLNYQDSYIVRKQPTESKNFNYPNSSAVDSTASPSKPVLRLMGKNLTVVKTDDDDFRPPQSSQRPVIFSQYQNGFESQHLNIHPTRSHVDFRPVHHGFTTPVDYYGNRGPYLEPSRAHYVHNDPQTVGAGNVYNLPSSSRPVKEIVIVDDSLENEDDITMRNRFLKDPSYAAYPSYVGGGSSLFSDNGNVSGKWNIGASTTYNPPSYP